MTLALAIVSRHGIWQSSDMRLYDQAARQPVSDLSTKQWVFKTADGIATVAYSGIGRLSTGDHVSDLMVRLLRGESRTLDGTLWAIRGFANERLAKVLWSLQWPHVFIVGAFLGSEPWALQISNLELERVGYPMNITRLRRTFETVALRVENDGIVMGVGQRLAVARTDISKLLKAAANRPAHFRNYLKLLGVVTRRAAHHLPTHISEQSHAVYLAVPPVPPPGPEWHPETFSWGRDVPAASQPSFLLQGLDLGSVLRRALEGMAGGPGLLPEGLDPFRDMIRLEPGVPVIELNTHLRGRVAQDPVPGGAANDVGVYWENEPRRMVVVDRRSITVLHPGHPDLV